MRRECERRTEPGIQYCARAGKAAAPREAFLLSRRSLHSGMTSRLSLLFTRRADNKQREGKGLEKSGLLPMEEGEDILANLLLLNLDCLPPTLRPPPGFATSSRLQLAGVVVCQCQTYVSPCTCQRERGKQDTGPGYPRRFFFNLLLAESSF